VEAKTKVDMKANRARWRARLFDKQFFGKNTLNLRLRAAAPFIGASTLTTKTVSREVE